MAEANNNNQALDVFKTEILTTDTSMVSENWFKQYWRPVAAWTFIFITIFDFVLAPTFYGWVSLITKTAVFWTPLTLQGGGLFYLAYGTILGLYTWGRTQEKKFSITTNAE